MTFRPARDFLFNSLVATIGVAIAESSVYSVFQPQTLDGAYLKEIILSAVIAFALGYIVYFKWEFRSAFWVWLIGLGTVGWRVALGTPHTGDTEEIGNAATLVFLSVRAVSYSFGALCCSWWLAWRR